MRKLLLLLLISLMLAGCSAAETFETLGPVRHQPVDTPIMADVKLTLPQSAAAQAMGGSDTIYDCEGYMLVMQTFSSGDFKSTVRSLSGFSPEKLTVLESRTGETRRYDWVWTAAGEGGDMICRAAVLDDGNYHYCLCTLAPAQSAGALAEEWNNLFASFRLGEGT